MHKGCPRGGGGEASKLIDRLVSPKLSGDSVRPVSCRTCLPVPEVPFCGFSCYGNFLIVPNNVLNSEWFKMIGQ